MMECYRKFYPIKEENQTYTILKDEENFATETEQE